MNKKTQKSKEISPNDAQVPCSMCNETSLKSMTFICDSGHIICKNCQTANANSTKNRKDSGDYTQEAEPKLKHKHNKIKKNKSEPLPCDLTKDMACGDFTETNKKLKRITKSEDKILTSKEKDIEDTKTIKDLKKNTKKRSLETIVEYKNLNFNSSDTSSFSDNSILEETSDNKEAEGNNAFLSSKTFCRPVTCPLTDCKKIIALDSAIHHFNFDHSKIRKVFLDRNDVQHFALQPSNFVTDRVECIGMFLLCDVFTSPFPSQYNAYKGTSKDLNKKSGLFLLGARLIINHSNTSRKENEANRKISKDNFSENEVFILWACKADDVVNIYSVTLLREDKKQGHSYVGSSVHIKDPQDVKSIYQKAECLIIHGAAANRLLDTEKKIVGLINILE